MGSSATKETGRRKYSIHWKVTGEVEIFSATSSAEQLAWERHWVMWHQNMMGDMYIFGVLILIIVC